MVLPLVNLTQEQVREVVSQPLIPLNVTEDRQYLISLRHGALLDTKKLLHILVGKVITPLYCDWVCLDVMMNKLLSVTYSVTAQ